MNSGCANACTGTQGMADADRMAAEVATTLGCSPEHVLVASTGVIGVNLRMDKVVTGIQTAVAALARGKGSDTARAIMTTDPFPKECAVTVQTGRGTFTVGGTAKGSGMIEPKMATMLGFLTTDAARPICAAAASPQGIRTRYLQRHHRRWRRARPTTRCTRWRQAPAA